MAYKSKHTGEQIDSGIDKALGMDNSIKNAVEAEANARTQAIATEVTDRNTAIKSAIDKEVTDRDSAIQSAIATEVTDRDSAIQSAIAKEVTDRNAAIKDAIDDLDLSGGGSSGGGTSGGGTSGGGTSSGGESYITLTATESSPVDLNTILDAGVYRIEGFTYHVENLPSDYWNVDFPVYYAGFILRVIVGRNGDDHKTVTQELTVPGQVLPFSRVWKAAYGFKEWQRPLAVSGENQVPQFTNNGIYVGQCTSNVTLGGVMFNTGDDFIAINRYVNNNMHQLVFLFPKSGDAKIYIRTNGTTFNFKEVVTKEIGT